jgi:hypothetical protein
MTGIPTEFPPGGPLDQAKVARTQIEATIKASQAAIEELRAAKGAALTETSVEFRAIQALQSGIDLAEKIIPLVAAL